MLGVARSCMPTGCPHSGPSTCIQLLPASLQPTLWFYCCWGRNWVLCPVRGLPRPGQQGTLGPGPVTLALSCSQFLTREAAGTDSAETGWSAGVWGWPWTQEGRLGTCRREAQLLSTPSPGWVLAPCDQGHKQARHDHPEGRARGRSKAELLATLSPSPGLRVTCTFSSYLQAEALVSRLRAPSRSPGQSSQRTAVQARLGRQEKGLETAPRVPAVRPRREAGPGHWS